MHNLGNQLTKKESKQAQKKKLKGKIIKGLTQSERNKIINEFYVNLINLDIVQILKPDIKNILKDYIGNGTQYEMNIDIPEYKRVLIVRLYNHKGKLSYINLAQIDTIVDGKDGLIGGLREKIDRLKHDGIDLTKIKK